MELYWRKWAYHFDSPSVKSTLRDNKVGDLSVCHLLHGTYAEEYEQDPERAPERLNQTFFTFTPPSSETHAHILKKHFLTPNEALYIRNHAPVPNHLSAASHDVTFSLAKKDETRDLKTSMSLLELRENFDSTDVISVMQCAGNRQIDDFKRQGSNGFTGTPYQNITNGMVGNVLWSGVRLDTLLRSLYPQECEEESSSPGEWHVIFTGADEYESSSPLSLVLEAATDGLLAFEMNGVPLLPDHGFPVRVVLPGLAGARNVKWLEGLTLSRVPCDKPWNAHYYRTAKQEHIQTLPSNSIILSPDKHSLVQLREDGSGSVSVQGVAYAGGGEANTPVQCVEVTADGGTTWTRARLLQEERETVPQDAIGDHAWIRFIAEVPVRVDKMSSVSTVSGDDEDASDKLATHKINIYSRATDALGRQQPEGSTQGQRSYLFAGWGAATLTGVRSGNQS